MSSTHCPRSAKCIASSRPAAYSIVRFHFYTRTMGARCSPTTGASLKTDVHVLFSDFGETRVLRAGEVAFVLRAFLPSSVNRDLYSTPLMPLVNALDRISLKRHATNSFMVLAIGNRHSRGSEFLGPQLPWLSASSIRDLVFCGSRELVFDAYSGSSVLCRCRATDAS